MVESDAPRGLVKALAAWSGKGLPMREVKEAHVAAGRGFEGHESARGKRGLTLLSLERWTDTMRELDQNLPWHTRRANLLTEGIDLAATIGKRLRIGEVEIDVDDETRPCKLMDELCPGLRHALKPDKRGGVVGEVVRAGLIRVGDSIAAIDRPA